MSIMELRNFFEIDKASPTDWPVPCLVSMPNRLALDAWPNWPAAASPSAGRAGAGKGLTVEDALLSSLGEMIEVASLSAWSGDFMVKAHPDDLPGPSWSMAELSGFSASQYAGRDAWNRRLEWLDRIPDPAEVATEWLPARDLSGGTVWLPAAAVLLGIADGDPDRHGADTNGAAAAATHREAQGRALMELIERDAAGRWWYGMRSRDILDHSILPSTGMAVVAALAARGLAVTLYDLTTDLGVPVVAAACTEQGGGPVSLGFSAASRYRAAALAALCETAQMRLVFETGDRKAHPRPGMTRWIAEVGPEAAPLSLGVPGTAIPADPPPGTLANTLKNVGIRVAFVNRTRAEFGVPVWRALSPDLCHWKPRLGRPRLLALDTHDRSGPAQTPNEVLLRL